MLSRIISAAAFALIASTLLVPTAAEAGSRWRFLNPGYYFYDPPPRDFYADEYDDEDYYEDERPLAYYDPDDDYYEPRYQPRYEGEEPVYIAPKKKKTVKAAKPVEKKSVASTKKKAVTSSVASVEKKAVTSTEKKTASAALRHVLRQGRTDCLGLRLYQREAHDLHRPGFRLQCHPQRQGLCDQAQFRQRRTDRGQEGSVSLVLAQNEPLL